MVWWAVQVVSLSAEIHRNFHRIQNTDILPMFFCYLRNLCSIFLSFYPPILSPRFFDRPQNVFIHILFGFAFFPTFITPLCVFLGKLLVFLTGCMTMCFALLAVITAVHILQPFHFRPQINPISVLDVGYQLFCVYGLAEYISPASQFSR